MKRNIVLLMAAAVIFSLAACGTDKREASVRSEQMREETVTENAEPASDGGELIDYAAKEQEEDARPELTNHIEGLDEYGTIETIQELEPEATVITDGFTVNERDVPEAADDVEDWLEGIGY